MWQAVLRSGPVEHLFVSHPLEKFEMSGGGSLSNGGKRQMKTADLNTWRCKSCGAENEIGEVIAEPIRQQLMKELRPKIEAELVAPQVERLGELEAENRELRANEVTLRRDRRALEKAKADQDLVVQRQLDDERKQIAEEEGARAAEQYRLRIQEQDEKIARLTRDLDETQQRLHQSPSELRGTTQELSLYDQLTALFPDDLITRVGKGRRGADVRQQVRDKVGTVLGSILYERKQAHQWSKDWLTKLREDMRIDKDDLGVLVTTASPGGRASVCDGVVIVQPDGLDFIGEVLRSQIVAIAQSRSLAELGDEPKDRVWEYVAAGRLWKRLQGIAEPMIAEWNCIQKDEEAEDRRNSRRKENLRRQARHVAGLCGDFHAIGAELPEVSLLELPAAG